MENYWSKLPNIVVYNFKGEESLVQITKDEKVLLILDYLYTNTNRKGISVFVLENLITEYGFTPNKHKGKINDKFRDVLKYLQDTEMIICDVDLSTINITQFVECKLDIFLKNEKGDDIQFFQLYDDVKEKILNQKIEDGIANTKLLLYYCYINSRIKKRGDNNPLPVFGGEAEVLWADFNTITKDLGFGRDTITKYNNILVELDLIRFNNAGLFYYKGDAQHTIRESCNTYCLYKEGWKHTLKEGIKSYIHHKIDEVVFVKSKKKDTIKNRNNGFINRINSLEKEGKASPEQIKKRDKLLEQKKESVIPVTKDTVDVVKKISVFDGIYNKISESIA